MHSYIEMLKTNSLILFSVAFGLLYPTIDLFFQDDADHWIQFVMLGAEFVLFVRAISFMRQYNRVLEVSNATLGDIYKAYLYLYEPHILTTEEKDKIFVRCHNILHKTIYAGEFEKIY